MPIVRSSNGSSVDTTISAFGSWISFDMPDRSNPGYPHISHASHTPPVHGFCRPWSNNSRNRDSNRTDVNRTDVGYRPSFFSLFCFSSQPKVSVCDYTQIVAPHQIHELYDIADNLFHFSVSAHVALCLIFLSLWTTSRSTSIETIFANTR